MKLTTTFWSEKEYTFTNVYFFNNKTKEIIFQTNLNNKRETYNFFKNISKFVLTKQVRFAPEDVGYQIGVMCDSEITPLKWFDLYLDNNLIKHDVACSTILITKNGIDLPFGSFSSKKKKPSKYREFKMESKAYKYLANQVMIPNVAVWDYLWYYGQELENIIVYNQKGKLQKNPQEELILMHMPLVKKIANQMYKKINFLIDLEDLVSIGTLGLMDAVQKYVEMDTAKFETYATIKVKGFILDELRKQDPLNQEERQVKKQIDILKQENSKIKETEIISKLKINTELYNQIILKEQFSYMLSIEESVGNDSGESSKSVLNIRDDSQSVEDEVYRKELIKKIAYHIEQLDEKEQIVMQLIYVEDLDAKDVAYVLKISPARVSQIHAKSIEKIKQMIK